jgi:fructuronate reductase
MDGTQKIPLRWGPTLAGLGRGGAAALPDDGVCFGLAAWAAFVERAVRTGEPLDDPRAAELRAIVEGASGPDAAQAALLALPGLLPPTLATDPRLLPAVRGAGAVVDGPAQRR